MFLGSTIDNNNITFLVKNKRIKSSNKVKFLGITIDDKPIKHINNRSNMASNRLRALTRVRTFLSHERAKRLSEAYILSTFKYCPLIWMFCGKTENSFTCKIYKRTLRLIYEKEDATLEDLLERDESKSIYENNIHTLLNEIDKSIYHISPPNMRNSFDLQVNQYNLCSNYLLKLPATKLADMVRKHYVFKEFLENILLAYHIGKLLGWLSSLEYGSKQI